MGREELKTKFHLSSVAKSRAPRSWHMAAIISCSLVLPVKRQESQRTEVWLSIIKPAVLLGQFTRRPGSAGEEKKDKPPISANAENQEDG